MDPESLRRAAQPFQFKSQLQLRQLTGLKATNLAQMLQILKSAPGSVIYHHTHHFLQQHQYLTPEPPNDFAYWVRESLQEIKLAEKLTSINICDYPNIRSLREKLIQTIEPFLEKNRHPLREAPEGQEMHFIKCVSFVLPTPFTAYDLNEFAAVLQKISIHSIYYHMFESRIRLEKPSNDFSLWLEQEIGETDLAKKIARLDPYTHTIEGLRGKILKLIDARFRQTPGLDGPKGSGPEVPA
ncbi:MAG TPA: DUF5752 family protein [Candidatus Omnitrophota bacterium]|nr:DUF5752 family protein [Candidatus Omnitrophota bacterium]